MNINTDTLVKVGAGLCLGLGLGFLLSRSKKPAETASYSMANQVMRYNDAKATNNSRVLNIDSVYDGAFLKGKRVLVTGANRGLGLKIAQQLVADGAYVVAVIRSNKDYVLAELQSHLGDSGEVLTGVDVIDLVQIRGMVARLGEPVDIVINNAGYFMEQHETLDTLNFFEELKQIDICALGPLRITSELYKGQKLKEGAKVIIITSQAGSAQWRKVQNANEGGDYGHHMSRAACNIAGVLMSEELRGHGISVTLLHPGFNRTDMTAKYADIYDEHGAVDAAIGAKRVLYEVGRASLESTGSFLNCEDGRTIPW